MSKHPAGYRPDTHIVLNQFSHPCVVGGSLSPPLFIQMSVRYHFCPHLHPTVNTEPDAKVQKKAQLHQMDCVNASVTH